MNEKLMTAGFLVALAIPATLLLWPLGWIVWEAMTGGWVQL